jgi:NADH:ubiquinone reductase (non-electrogenic)
LNLPRQKLIVLGTGFAGFSLIKSIHVKAYDVSVISPRNHFLFTPLLPSTTVGTIEFRSIIESIRSAEPEIRYYQAECTSIDTRGRIVHCSPPHGEDQAAFSLPYDILAIAVGAQNNTYGIPGVVEHALFLRELADARVIRQRIIDCFERAGTPGVEETERKRLLHFVVVGGGPTGVELAAEMHDFLVEDVAKSFRRLSEDVRITLLEATDHILSSFDETLSEYTMKHFKRQHIDLRTGSIVTRVEPSKVYVKDGSVIPFGLLVWSTGIGSTSFVRSLPFPKDRTGRISTDDYFRVQHQSMIYALGDCAVIAEKNFPATAQVAQQEGRYLAGQLNRMAKGKPAEPFQYKNLGMLAYIGGNRALADLPSVKGRGFTTWLFWRSVYLTRLVSMKNKILVIFDWLKTRIFGRDVSRF